MAGPLAQFEVKKIIPLEINGIDISFTNSSLFMVLAVVLSTIFLGFCIRKRTIVPSVSQSLTETIYDFLSGLLKESIGKDAMKYFPLIFTIFMFVAFGNLLGLVPYAFTFTSQLATVGSLAITALLINMCIGIKKKKFGYLRTFMPKGIPIALAPLIVPIEIISYLSKPFSLTVRLVANMTVGHIMLKIIAGFVVALGVAGIVPIVFNGAIVVFEMFIALLQAFIFTVLSCIYLGDAIHNH